MGEAGVEEAGGDLVADTFEQVEVLPGIGHAADAVADDHQPQKFVAADHGHADAVAALAEFLGMTLAQGGSPFFMGGIDVRGFVMFLEVGDDFSKVMFLRGEALGLGLGQKGGGGEQELFLFIIDEPDGDGECLEDVGDGFDGGLAEFALADAGGGGLGEFAPDGAVVEHGPLEMAADEAAEREPDAVGEQEDGQGDERGEDEKGLDGEGLVAADEGDNLGEEADDDEIDASEDDGQGILEDGVRGVDIDLKMAFAQQRAKDEEEAHEHHAAIDDLLSEVHGVEKERLGAGVDADDEKDAKAEDHELDAPAHGADGGAEGAFEVHEDENDADEEE